MRCMCVPVLLHGGAGAAAGGRRRDGCLAVRRKVGGNRIAWQAGFQCATSPGSVTGSAGQPLFVQEVYWTDGKGLGNLG